MTYDKDLDNYLKAMKSKRIKIAEVKPAFSERRQALVNQGKRCANCRKDINPVYAKYVRDPKTNTLKVLCSNCAVQGAAKR